MIETINVTKTMAMPVDRVWTAIAQIGGLDRWFPVITACRVIGSGVGAMNILKLTGLVLVLIALLHNAANATTRIAVLNFELNDITSLPNTQTELQRTASMAPLLMATLSRIGDYEMVPIDAETQKAANAGFGYLFHFHDIAARLGRQHGADWIIVSQHSKPSFLFSYLWVYLIDVKNQASIARYDIELKGNHEKVTRRGIDALTRKIESSIANYRGR